MFRFTIRDVLWLTAVSPLVVSATYISAQEKAPLALANTAWVVSDAFALGKPDREMVGTLVLFWGDWFHVISPDGTAESFALAIKTEREECRFQFSNKVFFGKGLAIRGEGDALRLFINESEDRTIQIKEPESSATRCDEMFVCLPLSEQQAKSRLAGQGILLGGK